MYVFTGDFFGQVFCRSADKLNGVYMEFKGEILGHLLKIITPRVIAELSTASSGKTKKPLSQLMADYSELSYESESETPDDDSKAKILPFGEASTVDEQQNLTYQCGPRIFNLMQEFSKLCEEMESNVLGPNRIPKKKMAHTDDSSDQLIEQKKKFENSYALLKSQEVLSLYKIVSKVNVIKEDKGSKRDDKDYLSDREKGILVNKKQA